jgi:hypothetical protein
MKKNICCNVEFGRYYTHGSIPCIEVHFKYDTEEIQDRTFYLSAFRGYAFQVSFEYNGSGDVGSSPVFGLETLNSIKQIGRSNLDNNETKRYFMVLAAMDAVYAAAQYPLHSREYKIGFIFSRTYDLTFNSYDEKYLGFQKFINNTFKFIKGEEIDKIPYGWDHVEVYN